MSKSKIFETFLSVLFMGASTFLLGQNAAVYPEQNEFYIGEHIELKLTFEFPVKAVLYAFPEFLNDTITKHFEIISSTDKTDTLTATDPSLLKLERKYIITSFDTGTHVLPPFPFTFTRQSSDIPDTIFSDSLFMTVNLVDVDTTQAIMDIKNPWGIPFQWKDYILHFIFSILIIALIVTALYFYMRRKKGLPLFPARITPPLPPDEEALLALNKIKKEKIWRTGLIKDYYTLLTDTLRRYIERRYNIPALEFTSADTITELKKTDIDNETSDKLEHVFMIADMVKFAKGNPVSTENENCLKLAYDFVLKTKAVSQNENQFTKNNNPNEINTQV